MKRRTQDKRSSGRGICTSITSVSMSISMSINQHQSASASIEAELKAVQKAELAAPSPPPKQCRMNFESVLKARMEEAY